MRLTDDPVQLEQVAEMARRMAASDGEPYLVVNEVDPKRDCRSFIPYAVAVSRADAFERKHGTPPGDAPQGPAGDRASILAEVSAERDRQDGMFGGAGHDDTHSATDWVSILVRHLGLAVDDGSPAGVCLMTDHCAGADPVRYRRQMVRVAAIAVAAVETFDRKAAAWVAALSEADA